MDLKQKSQLYTVLANYVWLKKEFDVDVGLKGGKAPLVLAVSANQATHWHFIFWEQSASCGLWPEQEFVDKYWLNYVLICSHHMWWYLAVSSIAFIKKWHSTQKASKKSFPAKLWLWFWLCSKSNPIKILQNYPWYR